MERFILYVIGRPAKIYIPPICAENGSSLDDQQVAMDDSDGLQGVIIIMMMIIITFSF